MSDAQAPGPYLIWNEEKVAKETQASSTLLAKAGIARWIKAGALLTLAVIAIPPFPMLLGGFWLLSLLTGYASALLIALLFVLPLRRLVSWPGTRISVPSHQKLADWALTSAVLHVALLIATDPLTIEYLMPTQPLFMWAGNLGALVLIALWVTSLEGPRVRLFGPHFRFRTVHVVGSLILIVFLALHMIGSGAYVGGPVKPVLVAALGVLLVLQTLKSGVRPERDGRQAGASQGPN